MKAHLTPAVIEVMRALWASGEYTRSEIVALTGSSATAVGRYCVKFASNYSNMPPWPLQAWERRAVEIRARKIK